MKKTIIQLSTLLIMLLGLPLLGVLLAGKPLARYLEFPPESLYVEQIPFSWIAFIAYCLFIIASLSPFVRQVLRRLKMSGPRTPLPARFPWWGWAGLILGTCAWILAWNRFTWFGRFQLHTFTPLWLSYIVIANALTYRRTGRCLMLERTTLFLLLFPVSALFWWFFEYLNRFVQNWDYGSIQFGPSQYFLYATLSFSTVLPAFASTRQWILSFPRFQQAFRGFAPLRVPHPQAVAALTLMVACGGLLLLGVLPHHLFPLLWISPLLILVSLQVLLREEHIFTPAADGDWSIILSSALAALVCGFFWEMWNYESLAKWIYRVPFVHGFQIFEMPLLGYAGYLPFGIECAVIADLVFKKER